MNRLLIKICILYMSRIFINMILLANKFDVVFHCIKTWRKIWWKYLLVIKIIIKMKFTRKG
jgi:hypothetical protein